MDYDKIKAILSTMTVEEQLEEVAKIVKSRDFWGFGLNAVDDVVLPRNFQPRTATEFLMVDYYLPFEKSEHDDWFGNRRNMDGHINALRDEVESWGYEYSSSHFSKDADRLRYCSMPYKSGIRCVAADLFGRPCGDVYPAASEAFNLVHLFSDLLKAMPAISAAGYLMNSGSRVTIPLITLRGNCLGLTETAAISDEPIMTVRELSNKEY